MWLNLDCWRETEDVHSLGGIAHFAVTLDKCKELCIIDFSCIAIDWEPSNIAKNCWIITQSSINVVPTQPGTFTHYRRNRLCATSS